jgi:hypothetical protein
MWWASEGFRPHRRHDCWLTKRRAVDDGGWGEVSERQFRRYRRRYEEDGFAGLVDRRLGKASVRPYCFGRTLATARLLITQLRGSASWSPPARLREVYMTAHPLGHPGIDRWIYRHWGYSFGNFHSEGARTFISSFDAVALFQLAFELTAMSWKVRHGRLRSAYQVGRCHNRDGVEHRSAIFKKVGVRTTARYRLQYNPRTTPSQLVILRTSIHVDSHLREGKK